MTHCIELIKIIEENKDLKIHEIIWLPEVRQFNVSTSDILVLIEKAKKNK